MPYWVQVQIPNPSLYAIAIYADGTDTLVRLCTVAHHDTMTPLMPETQQNKSEGRRLGTQISFSIE